MKAFVYKEDLNQFLGGYNYQQELTAKLDNLGDSPINQEVLNEIVLWKVNRYVFLNIDTFRELDALKNLKNGQHRESEDVLRSLLTIRGADLPMASTILRFRNPEVFQIIDRHAYRAVYDQKYPLYFQSSINRKVSIYFDYLDALLELCTRRELDFKKIDRILYIFDKRINGKL